MTDVVMLPLGEAALTIRLGEVATVEFAERSAALADAIRRTGIAGVREVVPAVASVTVHYDVHTTEPGALHTQLRELFSRASALGESTAPRTLHTIPTRYNGADLAEVAATLGLAEADVIRLHSAREYHVLALGFLPGWAYLGPLDPALVLPRRTTPRTRVPAGAVAIAGAQTGIYPRESPGGWHLLGSSDVVLFDPARDAPSLLSPGDRVRFVATVT